ncbi:unnamed protein product, partial [Meganyctiphanes norvegica]
IRCILILNKNNHVFMASIVTESHWGEMVDTQKNSSDEWTLSSSDMGDLLKPLPPAPTCPPLHQPSQEETPSFQIIPRCKSIITIMPSIGNLKNYCDQRHLRPTTRTVGIDGGSLQPCPAPPEDLPVDSKIDKSLFLNFLPPETTSFTSNKNHPQMLEVEGSTARLILRKAVATVCAHTGYTDTTESVLRVLTDITHEFLTKLTGVLRSNTDKLLLTDLCPFHDVVEHSLHDIGMGSMTELHHMYQSRVVSYHAHVQQEAQQLYQQYLTLTHSTHSNATTPGGGRRESSGDWWMEETSQPGGTAGISAPGLDDTSVPSIKSTSSCDPELSLHPFSVLSQVGGDGDDVVQSPAQTQQTFQMYPLTPR